MGLGLAFHEADISLIPSSNPLRNQRRHMEGLKVGSIKHLRESGAWRVVVG